MEDENIMHFELCNWESNFEPVTRARSNTWPIPQPEDDTAGTLINRTAMTAYKKFISKDPSTYQNQSGQTAGLSSMKKKSSRRNAWGSLSYAELITQAINSVKDQRLTLSQIYDWMIENVPFFKDKGDTSSSAGWKNSIRHNLSLHNYFIRVPNECAGKSSWWMINQDAKLGRSTRRRSASMEVGKYEKRRSRAKKQAEMLKKESSLTDVTSSPSSTEGIDFFLDTSLHATRNLQSPAFRPRASSCASSCGRLSPIPAAPNESEWIVDYAYGSEQFAGSRSKPVTLEPTYEVNEISSLSDKNADALFTYYQTDNCGKNSSNLQRVSTVYNPQEITQLCTLHQLESCNCNVNVAKITNIPRCKQTESYVSYQTEQSNKFFEITYANQCNVTGTQSTLMPIEESSDISSIDFANKVVSQTTTPTLVRNNSMLDDIDEIIRREQSATVDFVNNTMSTSLYITNNNFPSANQYL